MKFHLKNMQFHDISSKNNENLENFIEFQRKIIKSNDISAKHNEISSKNHFKTISFF